MANILIQGKNHDWSDVKIYIMGKEIGGITAINWGIAKEKSLTHATGQEPDGAAHGKKTYKCDFTLKLAAALEFEAIAKAAGKNVTEYAPFLIIIAYAEKTVEGAFVVQKFPPTQVTKILDVDLNDAGEDVSEGGTTIVRKYTAIAGKII